MSEKHFKKKILGIVFWIREFYLILVLINYKKFFFKSLFNGKINKINQLFELEQASDT
jgi:hypothetical protein